ncbi:hypothetical protein [Paraburkholderia atlantica]|uniref:Uncharacterized protein n=1 Tax=Paraburkholderia atlantica TaxID=2654982 RepID=D5WHJ1_PARAM|nr:hypothetical protein [Paraburkholderia atlantica]ADG17936.1 hypothetical protein BC1002_3925 [Paraburkholderia atlantica]MBB5509668.1 hypothetical protein [Paraburkholderia atlantica]
MQDPQSANTTTQQQGETPAGEQSARPEERAAPAMSDEVKARNKPSGTHYVEPSPLGIEPVVQTGVDKATNPPRSSERPRHGAEVPLGTGEHAEPPGGGGRESHRKQPGEQ